MAQSEQEILEGLAGIVNEVGGHPGRRCDAREDVRGRPRHRLAVHGRDRVAAEDKFGVTIPDSERQEPRTVGDVVAYIAPRRASRPGCMVRPHVEQIRENDRPHRRHRPRCDHPARRRRRDHLAGAARRPGRASAPSTGLGDADLPVRIAGTAAVDPSEVLTRVEARRLDRSQQFALIAAREAWADAGAPRGRPGPARRRRRLAASAASRPCSTSTTSCKEKGPRRVSPLDRADAHAQRPRCLGRPRARRPRRGAHPGRRLRVRRRGDRLGHGDDPQRPRRRRRRRRHRGGDPPAPHRRVRRDAGAVDPQRRARSAPPGRTTRAATASSSARAPASLVLESAEHAAARGARVYAEVAGAGHVRRRPPHRAAGARGRRRARRIPNAHAPTPTCGRLTSCT